MTTSRRTLLTGTAAAVAGAALTGPDARAQARPRGRQKPTVVLVHGAFADASGWSGVAARLIRDGYPVIAPANPLRGVAADSAYLASILTTLSGPLVLVAHSYGGMVVSNAATGNANVKSLLYVAAFVPDRGETLLSLQTKYPGSKPLEAALDIRPIDHSGLLGSRSWALVGAPASAVWPPLSEISGTNSRHAPHEPPRPKSRAGAPT